MLFVPACNEDLERAKQLYSSRFILFDKDITSDYQVKRSYHLVTFSEPLQKNIVVGSQANKTLNLYFCIFIFGEADGWLEWSWGKIAHAARPN